MTTKRGALTFAALLLVAGACGPDAKESEDPMGLDANMDVLPATATVVIDGTEWTYGCPDFPCPVMPIVAEHIGNKQFFWMPEGTYPNPTIYLYVLHTPVPLRKVAKNGDVKPPPPVPLPPILDGPATLRGRHMPPINQLVCQKAWVIIGYKDLLKWDYVDGTMVLTELKRDMGGGWVPGGMQQTIPLGAKNWDDLQNMRFAIYTPWPAGEAVQAEFAFNLRHTNEDTTYNHTLTHTLVCGSDSYFEPTEPPAPVLTGPTKVKAKREMFNVVCRKVDLALLVPDGAPWDFVEGTMKYEFYNRKHGKWNEVGWPWAFPLTANDWNRFFTGDYVFRSMYINADGFRVTIKADLAREYYGVEWLKPVEHSFFCVAPDFYALDPPPAD